MSLLAYVLRVNPQILRAHQSIIPDYVVRLLKDCPPEMSNARKELLVATRHVLSTDFRSAFLPKIDILANEKVLLGIGITVHDTLRPLAYSMLADLLHHVRAELTPAQLRHTIMIYSNNLHDQTLPRSIQTMCAKLLLNLVDRVMKIPNKSEGRQLLIMILDAFTEQLTTLNRLLNSYCKQQELQEGSRKLNIEGGDVEMSDAKPSHPYFDEFTLAEGRPIKSNPVIQMEASFAESPKDGRYLFKSIIGGLKTILFGIRSCNPPAPAFITDSPHAQRWNEQARGFSYHEVCLLRQLFREGVRAFRYYSLDNPALPDDSKPQISEPINLAPTSKEEKDVLEGFAGFFIHIDLAVFQEVFGTELEEFYTQIGENHALIQICQFLLASDASSSQTAEILLPFLVEQLEKLGEGNAIQAQIMIRLFRLVFMAVTLFPDMNESVLLPHLSDIINKCLKFASTSKAPLEYFQLLRALFRSIGGGRFEVLYKEVLPLLQALLESLNALIRDAQTPAERDLYVELCLTVPVRLSVLLPYLSYLMKPLVIALQGGPDLVGQGIRTLELCVDNLTQDFLDPILAPVSVELMEALRAHLKPLPHNFQFSHSVVRILGKLGGRNRKIIREPRAAQYVDVPQADCSISLEFHGSSTPQSFNHLKYIDFSIRVLKHKYHSLPYKRRAYQFLTSSFRLMVPNQSNTSIVAKTVKASLNNGAITNGTSNADLFRSSKLQLTHWPPRYGSLNNVRSILEGIFAAVDVAELKFDAEQFLLSVTNYLVMLEVVETQKEIRKQSLGIVELDNDVDEYISNRTIVDAVADALSANSELQIRLAKLIFEKIVSTATLIVGSKDALGNLGLFHYLIVTFRHRCYLQHWYEKLGGCRGIQLVIESGMDASWLSRYQQELIRALLFVIKDVPADVSPSTTAFARQTIILLLNYCNKNITTDEPNRLLPIIGLLTTELANPNGSVRETAQEGLRELAELTNSELSAMLTPVRDRLLTPILAKPLRALPVSMQVGHIEAIEFCLNLQPPLLTYDDALMRLLGETLNLAEADDEEMEGSGRMTQYRNSNLLFKLRSGCVKLLTSAMGSTEFSNASQGQLRSRTISILFKSLYSTSTEVVAVANSGLRQVLSQNHKLPKDILQAGLRPILMNLADYKRLSVSGLVGLARLLELLTNYFKVEIGKKLLDHMKAWATPIDLHEAAGHLVTTSQVVNIVTAIINVFHLLPPAANMFLEDLILVTVESEKNLRKTHPSSMRVPLLKFLNRYPDDTWKYFEDRWDSEDFENLFSQALDDDSSGPLRAVVTANFEDLMSKVDLDADEQGFRKTAALVSIITALIRHDLEWASSQYASLFKLLEMAIVLYKNVREECSQDYLKAKQIAQNAVAAFVKLMKLNPNKEFFFALAKAIAENSLPTSFEFTDYVVDDLILDSGNLDQTDIVKDGIDIFTSLDSSQEYKTYVFKNFINPIFISNYNNADTTGKKFFDRPLALLVNNKVWKAVVADSDQTLCGNDNLRLEVLQMSTLIVMNSATVIGQMRKEVIKVAWNYIKFDEIAVKQSAYVLIAHFIAAFDCPTKIVVQIYNALLRANQAEARNLVRQALDIIAPVLPIRIPESSGYPHWAQWPRRVMAEENHNIIQSLNIYQFLVRQADLFYPFREHFIPQIVSALLRLSFTQNSTVETKLLAIDLTEVILKWEHRRRNLKVIHMSVNQFINTFRVNRIWQFWMKVQFTSCRLCSENKSSHF